MITDTTGDLLDDDAEALVNGTNTGGVMGRGLALGIKRKFPEMFRAYERMARRGELQVGEAHVWATGQDQPRYVVNVPTRRHWRSRVRLADVEVALASVAEAVAERGIASVAIPALGCGSGGLDWTDVRPLVERAFAGLPDVDVRLYGPPEGHGDGPGRGARRPALTPGRAALLTLVDRYGAATTEVTVPEVERLAYFLQEAGHDLRLSYVPGPYGPVTDDLRHLLVPLEGTYLVGASDPGGAVELLPGVAAEAAAVVAASASVASRVERVLALTRGFESPYGLELLATAHWVVMRDDRVTGDPDLAVALVVEESLRPRRMFTDGQVTMAAGRLEDEGWFGPRPKVEAPSWA